MLHQSTVYALLAEEQSFRHSKVMSALFQHNDLYYSSWFSVRSNLKGNTK